MSYAGTIAYLYSLQQHGMKFGLDNIRRLLTALGDPQKTFRSVHVAGTNGKGSTVAMIEAQLRTAGVKTGMFTSPHLVSFTERMRVNGREIAEEDVVRIAEDVRQAAAGIPDLAPTFFEVVTAAAFCWFREQRVAWAVVEVGMGGRLDATNVLDPDVVVITTIALDHGEYLGRTLQEIAGEKAGIIKPGCPVVSAPQQPEALAVLAQTAHDRGAPLHLCGTDFSVDLKEDGLTGIRMDYRGLAEHAGLQVPLAGSHQAVNTAVAVRTVEELHKMHPELACDIRAGLRNVSWPGRLQFVKEHPPVLIDGAHNPQAAGVLAVFLRRALGLYSRIILVMGIMADKDREGIMRPLLPLAAEVIFAAPAYGRAAAPEMLAGQAAALGYFPRTAPTVADALLMAEDLYAPGDLIVVTGSFYTIGEAQEALGRPGVLARLRE